MTFTINSIPAVFGLLALLAMLVWLAVATRGRLRVLAVTGIALELLALLSGVLLGTALSVLQEAFGLSVPGIALLFSGTSTLLSTAGLLLLVLVVVTASRPASPQR